MSLPEWLLWSNFTNHSCFASLLSHGLNMKPSIVSLSKNVESQSEPVCISEVAFQSTHQTWLVELAAKGVLISWAVRFLGKWEAAAEVLPCILFTELSRFRAFLLRIQKRKLKSHCYWLLEQGPSETAATSQHEYPQFRPTNAVCFWLLTGKPSVCFTCHSPARYTGSPQRRPYCGTAQINPNIYRQ